jgi:hypothetical protein
MTWCKNIRLLFGSAGEEVKEGRSTVKRDAMTVDCKHERYDA